MYEYVHTGFNLVEAVWPLEDRRAWERARAAAEHGATQRRPRHATTRRRVQRRAHRDWWTLLIPERMDWVLAFAGSTYGSTVAGE
jgi:hypothetical protein